jgi:hypothetical protein
MMRSDQSLLPVTVMYSSSSSVRAGCPCPLPEMTSVSIRAVVAMYKAVIFPSRNSIPVIGSSDSKTVRCFAPLSWMRSPLTTVTAPFAKPTASCERSSDAAKAEMGNGLRPFWTSKVEVHFGTPVFLSILSNAQTLSTGSLDSVSVIVTSKDVPLICFR